jgi:hypothetical protein
MQFIHRTNAHERIKIGLFAGLIFWGVMSLCLFAYFLPTERNLEPYDLFIVSGMSLAAAILFGAAMSLRRPMLPPPHAESDDGEEGLGVPARLIPPSPVLGAKAFPESNEKEA